MHYSHALPLKFTNTFRLRSIKNLHFKFFYPLLFEYHKYAVNAAVGDLMCVLVKTILSCLMQISCRQIVYSAVWQIVRHSL